MEHLMKKMILSYELFKNQSYVDRLLKEGEIQGYKKILLSYETNINEQDLIFIIKNRIKKAEDELIILKAQEKIMNKMNKELEDNLSTLDITEIINENIMKYPLDVTERIKTNKCALKRPGKGGFNCNKPLIKGSKYCKEHLKKYDKITYTDLVGSEDD